MDDVEVTAAAAAAAAVAAIIKVAPSYTYVYDGANGGNINDSKT